MEIWDNKIRENLKNKPDHLEIWENMPHELKKEIASGICETFNLLDTKKILLAAGKLAYTARFVTAANAKVLTERVNNMEAALDEYDNIIIQATDKVLNIAYNGIDNSKTN